MVCIKIKQILFSRHRICFSRTSLSISKYCSTVSLKCRLNILINVALLKYIFLRIILAQDSIEPKAFMCFSEFVQTYLWFICTDFSVSFWTIRTSFLDFSNSLRGRKRRATFTASEPCYYGIEISYDLISIFYFYSTVEDFLTTLPVLFDVFFIW